MAPLDAAPQAGWLNGVGVQSPWVLRVQFVVGAGSWNCDGTTGTLEEARWPLRRLRRRRASTGQNPLECHRAHAVPSGDWLVIDYGGGPARVVISEIIL